MSLRKTPLVGSSICLLSFVSSIEAAVISNPGFENPLAPLSGSAFGNWVPFTGPDLIASTSSSTVNPRNGTNHLRLSLNGNTNDFAVAFQDVSITVGETLVFSGWHSAVNNSPTGIEIRIEWRDSNTGTEISRTSDFIPSPGATYESFSITETGPAGADTARLVYLSQSFTGSSNAVIDVDDISLISVPEPSSALLLAIALPLALKRKKSSGR